MQQFIFKAPLNSLIFPGCGASLIKLFSLIEADCSPLCSTDTSRVRFEEDPTLSGDLFLSVVVMLNLVLGVASGLFVSEGFGMPEATVI